MEALIRDALASDIPHCYEICLKTGAAGKDAASFFHDPHLLGQYYVGPYLFYGADSICLIAEADSLPMGYIVAVSDTTAFSRWMETVWLPPLRRRYPPTYPLQKTASDYEASVISLLNRCLTDAAAPAWLAAFPAHLHIDLLPPLQGRGVGRALMNTLLAQLEKRGCPGLHLGVAKNNTGAIAFYHKMGFTELDESKHGFTMGRKVGA
ncbi:MAG: GNAT family N-acetyltransferase [Treponema sp.]|jgi:GNAT superfamily N-acetyltransferase|nr:GNAT family N-acetyltransferase [Treponema sp.]